VLIDHRSNASQTSQALRWQRQGLQAVGPYVLTAVAAGGHRFLFLLSSIFAARVLGRDGFGQLSFVYSVFGVLDILGSAGLGALATKRAATARDQHARAQEAANLLVTSAILGLGITATAMIPVALSPELLIPASVRDAVASVTVAVFFTTVSSVALGLLIGSSKFEQYAIAHIVQGTTCLLVPAGAFMGGTRGAALGFMAGYAVGAVALVVLASPGVAYVSAALHSGTVLQCTLSTARTCLPLVLTGLLFATTMWVLNLIIYRTGSSFEEVAVYNAAMQLRNIVLFIPVRLCPAVLSRLSSLESAGEHRAHAQVLRMNLIVQLVLSASLTLPMLLWGEAISKLYGKGYYGGIATSLLMLSCIPTAVAHVLNAAALSKGRHWDYFNYEALSSSSCLVIVLVLSSVSGPIAVACGLLVAASLRTVAQFLFAPALCDA
jgi:O-antigen/teichoic acid export membrane protein